jgi:hypothetical protein
VLRVRAVDGGAIGGGCGSCHEFGASPWDSMGAAPGSRSFVGGC